MASQQAEQHPEQQAEQRPKVPGRPFKKGQSGNPSGKAKEPAPDELVPVPDEAGAPQQLRDVWHVYYRPESGDRTPGQKLMRRLWKEDGIKFVQLMSRLEAEWRAAKQERAGGAGADDPGARAAAGLVERMLREKPWEQS